MFNENRGRYQRGAGSESFSGDMKCERVDPAKRQMLFEKFAIAESYLGRFIGNILKHFTDERNVQGVRRLNMLGTCLEWTFLLLGHALHALLLPSGLFVTKTNATRP